ncbi:phospholipase effector Tle1 domain-containing protein [Photobacterium alginatilyticum]|uniref:phospholipase effector Tle1 domain-containing protein n=1 Tax=Photobacterium alginatilyticum TaxID=1775171 RepID=UPI00136F8A00
MAKNIILLSDGTGNSAAKLHKTNVWRTYKAIDINSEEVAKTQIALYDDGVGTSSFKPLKLLGGAIGWGLKQNVIDLYSFLSRNYEAGDDIYCFGFSRGAFTVRILVGLVANQGLAQGNNDVELKQDAKDKYESYLSDWKKRTGQDTQSGNNTPIPIKFVGVWDTVDAYGAPVDEIKDFINRFYPLYIPDRQLSQSVEKAVHALAIDDERKTFHPLLWDESNEDGNRIEQVWFSGVHSNVGGGYPDDDLSYVPLVWMLEKAQQHGLRLKNGILGQYRDKANSHGTMYDSRAGLKSLYRYAPRNIDELMNTGKVNIKLAKIHDSVVERIEKNYISYSPICMPSEYQLVEKPNDIVMHTKSEEVLELVNKKKVINWSAQVTLSIIAIIILFLTETDTGSLLSVFTGAFNQQPFLMGLFTVIFVIHYKINKGLKDKITVHAEDAMRQNRP